MTGMLDGIGYKNVPMRYTGNDAYMDRVFRGLTVNVTLMVPIDDAYVEIGELGKFFKPKYYLAMISQRAMWSAPRGKLHDAGHFLCLHYDDLLEFQRDWSLMIENQEERTSS